MTMAETPDPPYWAVIFTSLRDEQPDDGYEPTADRMFELAERQPGFLGCESAREGLGITVCYWSDEESIAAWKRQVEHMEAQARGRAQWYERYTVRIARVERAYEVQRAT